MDAVRNPKPKFGPAELWGACARCNARVKYSTLVRERLTGLLVCSPTSGRPVRSCLDPWPPVFDFQVYSDKSIDPPAEPLPLRYNLDDIWGNGPAGYTTAQMADGPAPAPDDATRLAALINSVPYYARTAGAAMFPPPDALVPDVVGNLTAVLPADYDGTFIPSSSVRTVTPPDEATELDDLTRTDKDVTDKLWSPPWAATLKV